MAETDETTSNRAGVKKGGRRKKHGKRTGNARKTVTSTKKPLYTCHRHGYHTDATASRESQMKGRGRHLGHMHGGVGTVRHGKTGRKTAKHGAEPTQAAEPRLMRIKAHNRVGGRGATVQASKLEVLTTNWLHAAADASGPVSAALVRCINDVNHVLGK